MQLESCTLCPLMIYNKNKSVQISFQLLDPLLCVFTHPEINYQWIFNYIQTGDILFAQKCKKLVEVDLSVCFNGYTEKEIASSRARKVIFFGKQLHPFFSKLNLDRVISLPMYGKECYVTYSPDYLETSYITKEKKEKAWLHQIKTLVTATRN